jgi:hypothetical protein
VVRSPRQVPALMRIAVDARAARAALLRGRRLFGPSLSFSDPRMIERYVPENATRPAA